MTTEDFRDDVGAVIDRLNAGVEKPALAWIRREDANARSKGARRALLKRKHERPGRMRQYYYRKAA